MRILKNKERHSSRKRLHYFLNDFSDKIIVEKSKYTYAQYFIIPTIFSILGIQYFKDNNYEPQFLILIFVGYIFSFLLNYFIAKKLRKNPEITLTKIGLTFSKTRTIFWKEILYYKIYQKDSTLYFYVKCENEEFYLNFQNLPIKKSVLKVLINSFCKKYNGKIRKRYNFLCQKNKEIEFLNFDNYLNHNIL